MIGAGKLGPRSNDDDAHDLADTAPDADTTTMRAIKAAVAATPAATSTRTRITP